MQGNGKSTWASTDGRGGAGPRSGAGGRAGTDRSASDALEAYLQNFDAKPADRAPAMPAPARPAARPQPPSRAAPAPSATAPPAPPDEPPEAAEPRPSGPLRFRSAAQEPPAPQRASRGPAKPSGGFNWAEVDRQLTLVPEVYRRPDFDGLRQLVTVLTAFDTDKALSQIQDHRRRVESLLDGIVRSHHGGFSRAIHNYSEILRLFSEAQSRVNALKRDLREGRARVGTHSSSLQHHWREAEMLRDALKELGDIETHAAAPAKLTEMLRSGQVLPCIDQLVRTSAFLARDEIQRIPALLGLRHEMAAIKARVDAQLRAAVSDWLSWPGVGPRGLVGRTPSTLSPSRVAMAAMYDSDDDDPNADDSGQDDEVMSPGKGVTRGADGEGGTGAGGIGPPPLKGLVAGVGRTGPLRRLLRWVEEDFESVLERALGSALADVGPAGGWGGEGGGYVAAGLSAAAVAAVQRFLPEALAVAGEVARRVVRLMTEVATAGAQVQPSRAVMALGDRVVADDSPQLGPGGATSPVRPEEAVAEMLKAWSAVQAVVAEVLGTLMAPADAEARAGAEGGGGGGARAAGVGAGAGAGAGKAAGAAWRPGARARRAFSIGVGAVAAENGADEEEGEGPASRGGPPSAHLVSMLCAKFPALEADRGPGLLPAMYLPSLQFLDSHWDVVRQAAKQLSVPLGPTNAAGELTFFPGVPVSTLQAFLSAASQQAFLPWADAHVRALVAAATDPRGSLPARFTGVIRDTTVMGAAAAIAGRPAPAVAPRPSLGPNPAPSVGAPSVSNVDSLSRLAPPGAAGPRRGAGSASALEAAAWAARSVEAWVAGVPDQRDALTAVLKTAAGQVAAAARQAAAALSGGTRAARLAEELSVHLAAEEASRVGGSESHAASCAVAEAVVGGAPVGPSDVQATPQGVVAVAALGAAAEELSGTLGAVGSVSFMAAAVQALGLGDLLQGAWQPLSVSPEKGLVRVGAGVPGMAEALRPAAESLRQLATSLFRTARLEMACRTALHLEPCVTKPHGAAPLAPAVDESVLRLLAFAGAVASGMNALPAIREGVAPQVMGLVGPVAAHAVAHGVARAPEVTPGGVQRLLWSLGALSRALEEMPRWKESEGSLESSLQALVAAKTLCELTLRPPAQAAASASSVFREFGAGGAAVVLSAKVRGRAVAERDWQTLARITGVPWARMQAHMEGRGQPLPWTPPATTSQAVAQAVREAADAVNAAATHAVSAIRDLGASALKEIQDSSGAVHGVVHGVVQGVVHGVAQGVAGWGGGDADGGGGGGVAGRAGVRGAVGLSRGGGSGASALRESSAARPRG